jgi:WD40 repeat protein
MNPITESATQRSGLQHIISRMQWYQSLTDILFQTSTRGAAAQAGLSLSLETSMVQLYANFLTYVMRSVRVYHQNRVLITLRDFVKYDDWGTRLGEIKQAEEDVRKDIDIFLSLKSLSISTPNNTDAIPQAIGNMTTAFQGWKKSQDDEECAKLISGTVASILRQRISDKKGELFQSCCDWFFESHDFQNWRDDPAQKVLLVTGGPGKGKTMLLCSLIDWFDNYRGLAYFFCLAEDSSTNHQEAVLKGLIREITRKIPELFHHVRRNKEELQLKGPSGELALFNTLKAIVEDPLMADGIIVIDALDECRECNAGREGLASKDRILQLVSQTSSSGVKWILSSRNYLTATIRRKIGAQGSLFHLDLDSTLPEKAVREFVRQKLEQFQGSLEYESELDADSQSEIEATLVSKAEGTYLYVSLVLDDIQRELEWEEPICSLAEYIQQKVESKPQTLVAMYEAMMNQICREKKAEHYQDIIRLVFLAERPLSLRELQYLVQDRALRQIKSIDMLKRVFKEGISFLSVKTESVSFIHQSARDFVSDRGWKGGDKLLAYPDVHEGHWDIFASSIEVLSSALRRDVYQLGHPGKTVAEVKTPKHDPLAPCVYSAVHLAHHLGASTTKDHQSEACSMLLRLFSEHMLHWFEALSLTGELMSSLNTMQTIIDWNAETFHQTRVSLFARSALTAKRMQANMVFLQMADDSLQLGLLLEDAVQLLMMFRPGIEECPLQVYTSALILSPTSSLVKKTFVRHRPAWLVGPAGISSDWPQNTVTLDTGRGSSVRLLRFGEDNETLSSVIDIASERTTSARLWHSSTGTPSVMLPDADFESGERRRDRSFKASAVSNDATRLISVLSAHDENQQQLFLWDATQGTKTSLTSSVGQDANFVISPDGRYIIAAPKIPEQCDMVIWDTMIGSSTGDNPVATDTVAWDTVVDAEPSWDTLPDDDITWDMMSEPDTATPSEVGASLTHRHLAYGPGRHSLEFLTNTVFASADASSVYVGDVERDFTRTIDTRFEYKDPWLHPTGIIPSRSWDINAGPRFALWDIFHIEVWDVFCEKPVLVFEVEPSYRIASRDMSENGNILALVTCPEPFSVSHKIRQTALEVWKLDSHSSQRQVRVEVAAGSPFDYLLALSRDGSLVALAGNQSIYTIEVRNTQSGHLIHSLRGHNSSVKLMAFSPDGGRLASAANDSTTRLWVLGKTESTVAPLLSNEESNSDITLAVACSPDRRRFATFKADGEIRLWDYQGKSIGVVQERLAFAMDPEFRIGFHDSRCVFSPDGSMLAAHSKARDETWKWDIWALPINQSRINDPSTLVKFTLPSGDLSILAFSQDGAQVAATSGFMFGGTPHELTIYSLAVDNIPRPLYPKPSWTLEADTRTWLWKHTPELTQMVFLRDGHLTCGRHDGGILIYDDAGVLCNCIAAPHAESALSAIQTMTAGGKEYLVAIYSTNVYSDSTLHVLDVTDRQSSTCVRRMKLDKFVKELVPDPVAPGRFFTNEGIIDLRECIEESSHGEDETLSFEANTLTGWESDWIMKDGRKMLWIPPAYRPRDKIRMGVYGSKVAISTIAGALLFFDFS